MPSGPLRRDEQADDDEGGDHRRGERSAERETAFGHGLARKSPTVVPSGRVRMKAAQNKSTRETLVQNNARQ
jgi:hypothetical protein